MTSRGTAELRSTPVGGEGGRRWLPQGPFVCIIHEYYYAAPESIVPPHLPSLVLFLAPIFELPLLAAALFFDISALALAFSSATRSSQSSLNYFVLFLNPPCFL
jgi:hypothetical protein